MRRRTSNDALINHAASLADGLKADLVVLGLKHHKVIVFVIAHLAEWALEIDAASASLPSCSRDKVTDTLLRFGSLVDVIVTGEDGVDAITHKERFQLRPQFEV